jgi:alanine dehydrogenase
MRIGIVKETKDREYRVALTPAGAQTLVRQGHAVLVQRGAGLGAGFVDAVYAEAGARLVAVDEAWDADLVVKVKEPLEPEYPYLKENMLFTFFHLAGVSPALTEMLLARNTTAIAYETVEDAAGKLPLLAPMSAIAGNMAITIGNYYLMHDQRGKGVQLGTTLGLRHGKVVVIGDGVVGQHAARTAAGLGAEVCVLGKQPNNITPLATAFPDNLYFVLSQPDTIAAHLTDADLVVGAVLLHGARAPHVVTEAMVQSMQPGSVIVDVSIDQGGCVATSRPTSHSNPVFVRHSVVHYCVTNMPGAYPRTATVALTHATLPYVTKLAQQGIGALRQNPGFGKGVNTYRGYLTEEPVADALGMRSRYRAFTDLADEPDAACETVAQRRCHV